MPPAAHSGTQATSGIHQMCVQTPVDPNATGKRPITPNTPAGRLANSWLVVSDIITTQANARIVRVTQAVFTAYSG